METNSGTSKVKSNRTYKDSVFKDLFSNLEYLYGLYQQLHPEDESTTIDELEVITINNVMVNAIYNDLCFRVRDKLVILVEHQATVNENMPLRMLFYVAEEYKRYVVDDNIYRRKLVPLPTPEFYVVYTGEKSYSEELRLSSAFHNIGYSCMELSVKVIKKAEGILGEYIYLIKSIETYRQGHSLEDAISLGLNDCIKKGILVKYLTEKRREVFDMLEEEFSFERYEKAIKEEGREEGEAQALLLANKVVKLRLQGFDAEEIAKKLEIDLEKVRVILE